MKKIFLVIVSFIATYNLFAVSFPVDSSYKCVVATRGTKVVRFEVGKGVKVWYKKRASKGIIDSISTDSIYISSFNKRNTEVKAIAINDIEALQPLNISKTRLHNIGLMVSGGLGVVIFIILALLGSVTAVGGISFILIPAAMGALCFWTFVGFGISYIVKTIKERSKKCERRKQFDFKAGN